MSRRSPARVRAARRRDGVVCHLDGVSAPGVAAIVRLERDRFWPGAVGEALSAWSGFVRDPIHRLWDASTGCGFMACCPDPDEVRGILLAAAAVLPPRDARRFRRRVAELDEFW